MILQRRQTNPPVVHSKEDIEKWIEAFTADSLPAYQMAAWLMAVCFNPLSPRETAYLTRCMVDSGETLRWHPGISLVDKHSTGGVGDKVSIVLAPLVASFGTCAVPMMAGRGLGHTGGTIDKLEAIPGFRTDMAVSQFQSIVRNVGCAIVSAGATLCPADRKLYALRDVTGTVSSLPLQTASIMCKKIAENPNSLVLDCKFGLGAFQPTVVEAEALARSMISTGESNGLTPTTAFLTNMNAPLGNSVGNFVEVYECIEIMKGKLKSLETSADLITLIVLQATQMLIQSDAFPGEDFDQVCGRVYAQLDNGLVLNKFLEMVQAQGGDISVVKSPGSYPRAQTILELHSPGDGYIAEMNALTVGEVAVDLGAGRRVADEAVDFCAGIQLHRKIGAFVKKGEPLATVHTNHSLSDAQSAVGRLRSAIVLTDSPPTKVSIVSHMVTSTEGATEFVLPNVLKEL